MYFASRLQAGRELAKKLSEKYRYENCAVIALDDGGVTIGAQIAMELHCVLTMLVSSEITLPRENEPIAGITAGGTMSFNHKYSQGEIDEFVSEYRGFIEQEKLARMHDMNQLLGSGGTINRELLRGHNVIIVSDGLKTSFPIDLITEFLKPISTEKLIFAVPFASVPAVDKMHVLADDLYCLNVVPDYSDTDRYYDNHDVPDHEKAIKIIQDIILKWK